MSGAPRPPVELESSDRAGAEFVAGDAGEGIHVAAASGGTEIILTPTVVAEFGGGALPEDWLVEPWKEGGRAIPEGGVLRLDGARAGHPGLFGSNRSLEFVATFGKRPHQHVGFGINFQDVPWVSFSTKFGHSLYARSNFFIPEDNRLPPDLLGSPHRFRIDWKVIDIQFWVDGERAAHQLVPIVGYMRPMASNASIGGDALLVEWMRMTPYRPAGVFTSRVHDAGGPALWVGCEWDGEAPSGTTISVEVRAGETAEADDRWSSWAPVTGDGAGQLEPPAGRFAQYRACLRTADPSRTPVLRGVTLRYSPAAGSPPDGSSGSC